MTRQNTPDISSSGLRSKEFSISLENMRCFAKESRLNIRPLTLLMGENSTGKTTVMSCLSEISLTPVVSAFDFNREPYEMGSFRDICHYGEPSFSVGFETVNYSQSWTFKQPEQNIDSAPRLYEGCGWLKAVESKTRAARPAQASEPKTRAEDQGQASKSQADINFKYTLNPQGLLSSLVVEGFEFEVDRQNNQLHVKQGQNTALVSLDDDDDVKNNVWAALPDKRTGLGFYWLNAARGVKKIILDNKTQISQASVLDDSIKQLDRALELFHKVAKSGALIGGALVYPVNFAPVRAKPKRTYDVVKENFNAEGVHMPISLLKLTKQKAWLKTKEQIERFARAAGLFSKMEIKQYGQEAGEPFQIQFNIRGKVVSNIVDVGYGISQILPFLVQLFGDNLAAENAAKKKAGTERRYLLQQPEVHLHPKAQAELVSLLVQNIKSFKKAFVIETHSDFMMGRLGVEIRRGNLRPQDVSLIYLESIGDRVQVHNIEFDAQGNIVGAPQGYRQFFLDETDRCLGFKE